MFESNRVTVRSKDIEHRMIFASHTTDENHL